MDTELKRKKHVKDLTDLTPVNVKVIITGSTDLQESHNQAKTISG